MSIPGAYVLESPSWSFGDYPSVSRPNNKRWPHISNTDLTVSNEEFFPPDFPLTFVLIAI